MFVRLLGLVVVLSLGGCSLWMPSPDPSQAWVDLGNEALVAAEVDEKPLEDDRYFQVTPGSHELGVRYRFEVSESNVGAAPVQRDCRITLDYAAFDAGQRYRLVTGQVGFRPWARLLDERNQVVAHGEESGCGSV